MYSRESILNKFIKDRHGEGEPIPHEYFWDLFGLKEPKGNVDIKAAEKVRLKFASMMENLKNDLLDDPEIYLDLVNMRGRGYFIVPHQNRADVVEREARRSLNKDLKWFTKRMSNIKNPENLSYTQQRQRDFMLQKFDAMRRDLRARPRYPKS